MCGGGSSIFSNHRHSAELSPSPAHSRITRPLLAGTGNGMADFALGLPLSSGQEAKLNGLTGQRSTEWALQMPVTRGG